MATNPTERVIRFRPKASDVSQNIDTRKCNGCPIQGQHRPINPVGPDDARFVVVTDVPSQAAAKEKRILPPGSSKVFAREMEDL